MGSRLCAWVNDSGAGVGAAWGDYDYDGFVDLYVANTSGQNNFLYRNNGDGTMTRITKGPPVTSGGNSHGCVWTDYDGDGYLDLLVTGGNGQNEQQFHNNRDGTFTRITQGPFVKSGGNSMGISPADYYNDGDLDLLVTGLSSRCRPASSCIHASAASLASRVVIIGALYVEQECKLGSGIWRHPSEQARLGHSSIHTVSYTWQALSRKSGKVLLMEIFSFSV